ncbi:MULTISPECIES: LytR/AlgR family response regulator transcription factor [Prevotella]|uniref:DNA-binding response regulator n=1 Tax=Prevotella herbatica TaxID=2801997 RepID=A0ABN6EFQ2_9BACT|nr:MULTISPECIES: LytTR family DNA-binding domain-containing protein [Prevotella]MDN5552833.1 LytTR family DNA-binding domain-containing protein [Prevotella sp.]BCS84720.1 DNA-binding response regulator [Prevotella herbatica]
MKILIIEDELSNTTRLCRILKEIEKDAQILATTASNKETKDFFSKTEEMPDLILADIQLGDGLSFEALKSVPQSIPVIFTTAYDQYAIKAFKFNSIDYLLKPIDKDELKTSINQAREKSNSNTDAIKELLSSIHGQDIRYRERFLVPYRDGYEVVLVTNISHICTVYKDTRIYMKSGYFYSISLSLDDIISQLDPTRFFRVNRQFIINIDVISQLKTYFAGKARVYIKEYEDLEIMCSRERVPILKSWLNK